MQPSLNNNVGQAQVSSVLLKPPPPPGFPPQQNNAVAVAVVKQAAAEAHGPWTEGTYEETVRWNSVAPFLLGSQESIAKDSLGGDLVLRLKSVWIPHAEMVRRDVYLIVTNLRVIIFQDYDLNRAPLNAPQSAQYGNQGSVVHVNTLAAYREEARFFYAFPLPALRDVLLDIRSATMSEQAQILPFVPQQSCVDWIASCCTAPVVEHPRELPRLVTTVQTARNPRVRPDQVTVTDQRLTSPEYCKQPYFGGLVNRGELWAWLAIIVWIIIFAPSSQPHWPLWFLFLPALYICWSMYHRCKNSRTRLGYNLLVQSAPTVQDALPHDVHINVEQQNKVSQDKQQGGAIHLTRVTKRMLKLKYVRPAQADRHITHRFPNNKAEDSKSASEFANQFVWTEREFFLEAFIADDMTSQHAAHVMAYLQAAIPENRSLALSYYASLPAVHTPGPNHVAMAYNPAYPAQQPLMVPMVEFKYGNNNNGGMLMQPQFNLPIPRASSLVSPSPLSPQHQKGSANNGSVPPVPPRRPTVNKAALQPIVQQFSAVVYEEAKNSNSDRKDSNNPQPQPQPQPGDQQHSSSTSVSASAPAPPQHPGGVEAKEESAPWTTVVPTARPSIENAAGLNPHAHGQSQPGSLDQLPVPSMNNNSWLAAS